MGKLPLLFRAALGVAGVALFVLLAFLLFGTPGSPLSAPAAPTFTPPRPSVVPTVIRQTITPTLATIAITATVVVTPTSVATTRPTPTVSTTPALTSTLPITTDWKVYENREQGFRIKYPPHFTYSLYGPSGIEVLHEMIFCDGAKYQPCVSREFPLIGLAVITNPQRLSVDDWAKAHVYSPAIPLQYSIQFESYQNVRTLLVAGVQAKRLLVTSAANGLRSQVILIPLIGDSKIIYLHYRIDPTSIEPFFEVMALTLERTP